MYLGGKRMRNLYNETLDFIHKCGYKKADVAFCSVTRGSDRDSYEFQFSFKTFEENSKFEYHSGYGGQEIDPSLKIVLNDGSWLERAEYDGAEWWEFKKSPVQDKDLCLPESATINFQYHRLWYDERKDPKNYDTPMNYIKKIEQEKPYVCE